MQQPFSEAETQRFLEITGSLDRIGAVDARRIGERPASLYQSLLDRFNTLIKQPQKDVTRLTNLINEVIPVISRPTTPEIPLLPFKMRARAMVSINAGYAPSTTPKAQTFSFPLLPQIPDTNRSNAQLKEPIPGSLYVVRHPSIGNAQICKVLGKNRFGGVDYYLISFFIPGLTPTYVTNDHLFAPDSGIQFPLNESRTEMATTVDWLLERIISTAQSLVFEKASGVVVQENQGQIFGPLLPQQVLFQAVPCASLLVLCYVAANWGIPELKIRKTLETIVETCIPRFQTSQESFNQILQEVQKLLSLSP